MRPTRLTAAVNWVRDDFFPGIEKLDRGFRALDANPALLDANFNNGIRAILNWVDMDDVNEFHLVSRNRFIEK